jgi:uncharacterized membrane protein YdbT with pleckstrin-like domain
MDPDKLPAPQIPRGKIQAVNPSETLVLDVRRHPFGLVMLVVETVIALAGAVALILFLLPSLLDQTASKKSAIIASLSFFALIVVVLGALFLLAAAYIYKANRLICTNLSVTQVNQMGLFNQKVSEIAMSNVEDVTSLKQGIFPTMFNYGTIKVETAGEQNNFIFPYCPDSDSVAKAVLDAREKFITRRNQATTPAAQPPQPQTA